MPPNEGSELPTPSNEGNEVNTYNVENEDEEGNDEQSSDADVYSVSIFCSVHIYVRKVLNETINYATID